ncbi:M10 family metallopeptidase, partial [Parasulfitobacter algicola]
MSGTGKSTKLIGTTGDQKIDGLLFERAWDGPITYSFPTSSGHYSYSNTGERETFGQISSQQKDAARTALDTGFGSSANDGFSVEGFTNMSVSLGSTTSAHLRFGESSVPGTAYAYLPGSYPQAGDVWFGRAINYRSPEAGNYEWATMYHEIGHALGLLHPHEGGDYGTVPLAFDSMEHSIMSYRAYQNAPLTGYTNETNGYAQTFMRSDIAALQHMYGADFTTNSNDTVYSWAPNSGNTLVNGQVGIDASGNRIFATIWDGGGIDTYDLSAYSNNLNIDLAPGAVSSFSATQTANLGRGNFAEGNIYNAYLYDGDTRSLIENAIGGSGNDTISGNQAQNDLQGGSGNDMLSGLDGSDTLSGGSGSDVLDGGLGFDF